MVLTGSIPNSLPEDIYTRLMRQLAGRGDPFVVDAPASFSWRLSRDVVSLIKPNNHEIGRTSAAPETPEECVPLPNNCRRAARVTRNRFLRRFRIPLLLDEYGETHVVPSVKIHLVNAAGAGDSMVGGFLAKTTQG